jgi:hypothetical protein
LGTNEEYRHLLVPEPRGLFARQKERRAQNDTSYGFIGNLLSRPAGAGKSARKRKKDTNLTERTEKVAETKGVKVFNSPKQTKF